MSDLVYIIDEPSIGLHPEDIQRINEIILSLKNKGNTVLVVEHDPDVIKIADYIIDLGPLAGKYGGDITFTGSYHELLNSTTHTGDALRRMHQLKSPNLSASNFINLKNVSRNNIKNMTVTLPEQAMTVVTGVAGSGKSSLIHTGLEALADTIFIDQKPAHASSRSIY